MITRLGLASIVLALVGCMVPVQQGPAYGSPGYGPPPYGQQQAATCTMGSDGVQACGYDCRVGSDGVAACANAPGGRCALGADGHVYCSETQSYGAYGPQPPTQCELNSDGSQTCGYNCRLGSDGHHYCASTPNGSCGLNSDGSFTCS
jgi:hypothetical protein